MAGSNGSEANGSWEAFTDYQHVSRRVAESVDDAIESYAVLQAAQTEGAQLEPEQWAQHKAHILSAATMLVVELEREAESQESYEEILERWKGAGESRGYLQNLQKAKVKQELPGWLYQLVIDIRRAAFELGYLQSGKTKKKLPDDETEAETEEMFSEL